MPQSGQGSSPPQGPPKGGPGGPAVPPRPAGAPRPPARPVPRSLTPRTTLKLEVEKAAQELVVDDFVDTYFRERPKTLPELRLEEPSIARAPVPPAPPPEPRPAEEDSGVRVAVPPDARDDAIEVSIAEHEADLVALEAQLADRDEHIESMQGEMLRLQMELDALRRARSASGESNADAPTPPTPSVPTPRPPATLAAPTGPSLLEAPPATPPAASPNPVGLGGPQGLAGGAAAAPADADAPRPHAPGLAAADHDASSPAFAEAAGRGRTRVGLVVGTATAVVLLGAVAFFVARPSSAERGSPSTSSPTEARTATSIADAPRATASVAATSAGAAPRAPASSAASTSATPASAASAPSATPASADVDVSKLLSFQAYLTVRSNVDAEVVVQGQPVGRTNRPLLVRCGPRNVRIRDDRGWRSGGEHVQLTCMHSIIVAIDASP